MINSLKISIGYLLFWFGYYWFKVFNVTPNYSCLSLRKLFYSTNGDFNRKMSSKIGKEEGSYNINGTEKSFLGPLSDERIKSISEAIRRDGYYKFDAALDERIIKELTAFSLQVKAKLMPAVKGSPEFDFYTPENPLTIKYEYQESDLVQDHNIQNLVSDPGLLAIAQSYLGAKPILDMISMWWSTSFSRKASSEVAQLYHFDMERIKFLKIFFYLTDVDSETGPHCYVKGSNNGFPPALQKDGRISDEEIKANYPSQDILEITGKKGTILAVDTSGFHKGKNLTKGNRLLLQFEFANSLFGVKNTYYKVVNQSPQFSSSKEKYPHTFQRYS